jgi:hypothetical protein
MAMQRSAAPNLATGWFELMHRRILPERRAEISMTAGNQLRFQEPAL